MKLIIKILVLAILLLIPFTRNLLTRVGLIFISISNAAMDGDPFFFMLLILLVYSMFRLYNSVFTDPLSKY
jgi:hypothetical protein